MITLNEALETVAKLSLEKQEMLSEIIHNQVVEQRRKMFAKSVKASNKEYELGLTQSGSVEDFLKDCEFNN